MKRYTPICLLALTVLSGLVQGENVETNIAANASRFRAGNSVRLAVTYNVHDGSFSFASPVLTNEVVHLFDCEGQTIGSVIMSDKTQSDVIWPVLRAFGRSGFSSNFTVNVTATNRTGMSDFTVKLHIKPDPVVRQQLLPLGDYWTPDERLLFHDAAYAWRTSRTNLSDKDEGSPTPASKTLP